MATSDLANSGGFERGRYFSRAWSLLTREKGWWKPVAVCAAADLVPVAGPLGVLGYRLEWARLVAWGADVSPKRHGVRVGSCISSGWRGFLVLLVWSLVMGVIGGVCGALPLIGGLLGTLWTICCLYLGMVVSVAELRATIYQKAGAGFSWKNLVELGRRDPSGLLSILGWEMLCYLVIALVGGIVLSVTALGAAPRIISLASELGYYNSGLYGFDYGYGSPYGGSEYYVAQLAMELFFYVIAAFGPTLIVLGLIALVLRNGISMVVYAALGLWIRQFDVANWGRSEEPLPSTAFAGEKVTDAAAPVAPATVADAPAEAPVRPAAPAAEPTATAAPAAEPTAPGVEPEPAAVEPAPVAAPAESAAPAASEPEYAPDGSEVIGVELVAKAAPEQDEPAGEGPADEESDAPAQE